MFGKKTKGKVRSRKSADPSADAIEPQRHKTSEIEPLPPSSLPSAERAESPEQLEKELSELYREMAPQLFRYGLLLTRNAGLSQDAVQETFLKYYVQRKQGGIQSERAWLFRVLRNYLIDQQKSVGTKMSVGLEAARSCADKSQSPEKAFEHSEAIKLALEVLSPRELQCLQLRTEGFSYKEIAEILDIEPGTVGAMLARSADKIRKIFGEERLPCEAL